MVELVVAGICRLLLPVRIQGGDPGASIPPTHTEHQMLFDFKQGSIPVGCVSLAFPVLGEDADRPSPLDADPLLP